jgi:hypothetical protein
VYGFRIPLFPISSHNFQARRSGVGTKDAEFLCECQRQLFLGIFWVCHAIKKVFPYIAIILILKATRPRVRLHALIAIDLRAKIILMMLVYVITAIRNRSSRSYFSSIYISFRYLYNE